jgi:hypothetical protein
MRSLLYSLSQYTLLVATDMTYPYVILECEKCAQASRPYYVLCHQYSPQRGSLRRWPVA